MHKFTSTSQNTNGALSCDLTVASILIAGYPLCDQPPAPAPGKGVLSEKVDALFTLPKVSSIASKLPKEMLMVEALPTYQAPLTDLSSVDLCSDNIASPAPNLCATDAPPCATGQDEHGRPSAFSDFTVKDTDTDFGIALPTTAAEAAAILQAECPETAAPTVFIWHTYNRPSGQSPLPSLPPLINVVNTTLPAPTRCDTYALLVGKVADDVSKVKNRWTAIEIIPKDTGNGIKRCVSDAELPQKWVQGLRRWTVDNPLVGKGALARNMVVKVECDIEPPCVLPSSGPETGAEVVTVGTSTSDPFSYVPKKAGGGTLVTSSLTGGEALTPLTDDPADTFPVWVGDAVDPIEATLP